MLYLSNSWNTWFHKGQRRGVKLIKILTARGPNAIWLFSNQQALSHIHSNLVLLHEVKPAKNYNCFICMKTSDMKLTWMCSHQAFLTRKHLNSLSGTHTHVMEPTSTRLQLLTSQAWPLHICKTTRSYFHLRNCYKGWYFYTQCVHHFISEQILICFL